MTTSVLRRQMNAGFRERWMGAALLLALAFFLTVAAPARAQTEAEITAVMDRWSTTYGTATDGADMLALYHPDAVFFGTAFRVPFIGAEAFAPYFQAQFDNYPTRQVTFVDPVIRIITPDVATSTGLYRFNVANAAGQTAEALYRYTFALVRTEAGWVIIQHHSSQLP